MPRLSVLMTVYNGWPYLPEAIDSVLNQSYQDFELIVVNDGSTDKTREYLDGIRDSRLIVMHRENGGTAAAANQGLQACRGEYCARMDADDISLANRFRKQVEYLEQHPEIDLLGAQVAPLGAKSVGKSLALPLGHNEIYTALRTGRHALAHSAIMMRTDAVKRIGGYWQYRLIDDWDMMLRIAERGRVANLPDLLHHYRIHDGSLNGSQMRRVRLSIDYACELARCRETATEPMTVEEFERARDSRSWWQRTSEKVDIFARCNYRLAVAEMLGGARFKGYCRLCIAALCQPQLSLERCARVARVKLRLQGNNSVRSTS